MNSDRWDTLQSLYLESLEMADSERESFLRERCEDQEDLFRDVLSLLQVEIHPLLDGLAVDVIPRPATTAQDGDQVDRFRLLDRIGEGGMGVVYRAERADGAYEQTVALKLVKPGMDSKAVLRRFRSERQILAGLRHPGIARLLDGGLHLGRPYLVVEYVDGEPITRYCNRHRLDLDARLALFEQVCEAVAYAHQNLIVHRDLKPSNILVTETEAGEPQVKLLDFGIARLLQDSGESQAMTQAGERALTPAYAAPEQIAGGRVTTATDVYGLGVVLHELLTGVRPIEPVGDNLLELERAVLEEVPPAPSAREASEEIARERRATTAQLRRRLSGDLDTIILMSLRKEPDRRYASAEGLLGDLKRHRENLPVAARPDRASYRIRKFVRRHSAGVAAALTVLILVTSVVAVAFVRVRHERDRARLEASKAAEVAAFMQEIFAVSDPSQSRGETVTARELLDRGAQRIEMDLSNLPEVQAQMLHVVGEVYGKLGLLEEADTMLHKALELRRSLLSEDHIDLARTLHALGILYELRGRYESAVELDSAAVEILKRHADEEELANSLHSLAHAQMRLGELEEAEQHIVEAVAMKRRLFGDTHTKVAYSLNILGDVYNYQGRPDRAEPILRDVLEMRRQLLGDDHLEVGVSLHNLGAALLEQKQYADAEPLYREALRIWLKVYGRKEHEYANTLSQLALAVGRQGRFAEAGELHLEALAVARSTFGEAHPRIAAGLIRYAGTLGLEGRYGEAESAYREAVAMQRGLLGDAHPTVPRWLVRLGEILRKQERFEDAERTLQEAYQLCATLHGTDSPCMEAARASLAELYKEWGRPDRAGVFRNS